MGDASHRPKVTLSPDEVTHHKPANNKLVEKELNVYTNKDQASGEGPAKQVPLEQVLPQFQRAAEDAIERELIAPAYRDHVRRYYADLHRK